MNKINLEKFLTFNISFLIVLTFIPIGKSPVFPIAPINIFYFLSIVVFFLYKFYSNQQVPKHVYMLVILILLYQVLIYYLNIYKYGESENFYSIYKPVTLLIAFSMIIKEKSVYFLFKTLTLVILFSMFFGILIHFIGEPFSSIRMFVLGSENEYAVFVGRGDRLSGFDSKLFSFAYPLAALPILLLTLYKIENQRLIYLLLLFLTIIGIVLNGERATALFSIIVFIFLVWKWFQLKNIYAIIGINGIFLLIFYISNVSIESSYFERLITEKEEGEISRRLIRQFIGLRSIAETPFLGSNLNTYQSLFFNQFNKIPAGTHNAFINIGISGGIIGWLLFVYFIKIIFNMVKIMRYKMSFVFDQKILYQGIISALLVTQLVSLTHNAGLFNSYEKTSVILLGFIIACANMSIPFKQNQIIKHS